MDRSRDTEKGLLPVKCGLQLDIEETMVIKVLAISKFGGQVLQTEQVMIQSYNINCFILIASY